MSLPWSWARVVKASKRLSPTGKLIWLEHVALDNDHEHARIAATTLGARIGLARITVKRYRVELVRVGLLVKHARGQGRVDAWEPTLPPDCRPTGRRIDADAVEHFAELLDRHLGQLGIDARDGVGSPHEPTSSTNLAGTGTEPEYADEPTVGSQHEPTLSTNLPRRLEKLEMLEDAETSIPGEVNERGV